MTVSNKSLYHHPSRHYYVLQKDGTRLCDDMDWTHGIDDWDTPVNYCINCGAVSYD